MNANPTPPAGWVAGRRVRPWACLAALALGAAGCGEATSKTTAARVPTTGKVTFAGKPLADATVEFIPVGSTPGQGGYGQTDDEGLYSVSDHKGKSGLPAGDYKVTVSKPQEF